MSFINFDRMGDKLRIPKRRMGLIYIPNNFVLQRENLFTGRPVAVSPGLKWFWLPEVSRAEKIEPETLDFNMQKIDAAGNQDVTLDLAITYEIDGGLRYDDPEVIKSNNFVSRRAWSANHGIHNYVKAFNSIADNVSSLINQSDHANTEGKTGILDSAVYDVIRRNLTGIEFKIIQKLGRDNMVSPEHPEWQKYVAADILRKNIEKGISERFREYGLKIIAIDYKNIKQSSKTNEIDEQIKQAEKGIILAKTQGEQEIVKANYDAQATVIRGNAEAAAKKAVTVAGLEPYKEVPADTAAASKAEKMYYVGGLTAAAPVINSILNPNAASNEDIVRTIKTNVENTKANDYIEEPVENISNFAEETNTVEETFANPEPVENVNNIAEETNTVEEAFVSPEPVENANNFAEEANTVEEAFVSPEPVENVNNIAEDVNTSEEVFTAEANEPETDIFTDNEEKANDDVIILPAQEILSIEDKGNNEELDLFDEKENDNVQENDIELPSLEELFNGSNNEEKPSLSDSQVEELTFEPETNEEVNAYTFFDDMDKEEVENAPEEVNNQESIEQLKEMKEELTAAVADSVKEEEIDSPEVEVTDVLPQTPVVDEKPKGLNLDFINSTWGRK